MKTQPPVLLVDASCLIWKIVRMYETVLSVHPQKADKWLRAMWTIFLNQPTDLLPFGEHQAVWILDTKKRGQYWRHKLAPQYKGGREKKSAEYWQCKRMLLTMLREPKYRHIKLWAVPLYEADDIVAEACRIIGKKRETYIISIDCDLLQLVTDNVKFAWTYNGKERLKDVSLSLSYIENKLKCHLRSLKDFGKLKSVVGDKSDNMPNGGNLRIFDLTKRDKVYSLKKQWKLWPAFCQHLQKTEWVDNRLAYNNAILWCQQNGLPIANGYVN